MEKPKEVIRLNVGCGKDIKKGYINLDQHLDNGADLVYVLPHIMVKHNKDYNNPVYISMEGDVLPYLNNSVDEIYCSHVLEDFVYEFEFIMSDFHRVLKPGGLLHIRVPYGTSFGSFYHKRSFDKNTFKGFINLNLQYQEKGMFSKIESLKVRRLGLVGRVFVFILARLPNNEAQKVYRKTYGAYENPTFWSKTLKFLGKIDPKLTYRYEIDVRLIK
jgi:SAM-dependent methyltransferase